MAFQTVFVNDVLDGCVASCWIILALKVVAKEAGESLPHKGTQSAFQLLHNPKSGLVGLAVNESNEDHTFSNCQSPQLSFKPNF